VSTNLDVMRNTLKGCPTKIAFMLKGFLLSLKNVFVANPGWQQVFKDVIARKSLKLPK